MPKLYLLSLLVFFAACSKTHDTNNLDKLADGDCQYKVNGSLILAKNKGLAAGEWSRFVKRVYGYSPTAYDFDMQKSGGVTTFNFRITTDSLQVRNYTYDNRSSTAVLIYNNAIMAAAYWTGDYLSINITSYSNSLISGNFTAQFSPADGFGNGDSSKKGTIVITEGLFKNIPCSYWP